MTRKEFLAELAKTPRAWKVNEDGVLRCDTGDCPITAVYRSVAKRELDPLAFPEAARVLNTDFDEFDVAEAADNGWIYEVGRPRRKLHGKKARWRTALLKACGLA